MGFCNLNYVILYSYMYILCITIYNSRKIIDCMHKDIMG